MKNLFLFLVITVAGLSARAQDTTKKKIYDPLANAEKQIKAAVKQAKDEGKYVLIQVGGNWCIWCHRFEQFVNTDTALKAAVERNYIVYHLNYSSENKNAELLKKYRYPNRLGFPVFLVLDGEGELIHTQNSAYLEKGKSYSKEQVLNFFNDWSPQAMETGKKTL